MIIYLKKNFSTHEIIRNSCSIKCLLQEENGSNPTLLRQNDKSSWGKKIHCFRCVFFPQKDQSFWGKRHIMDWDRQDNLFAPKRFIFLMQKICSLLNWTLLRACMMSFVDDLEWKSYISTENTDFVSKKKSTINKNTKWQSILEKFMSCEKNRKEIHGISLSCFLFKIFYKKCY